MVQLHLEILWLTGEITIHLFHYLWIQTYNIAVNFVNTATNDLHLTGASIGNVSLLGDVVSGINTDIDGDLRGVKPYMGADQ
ncbi:MAG: hypothetical protein R2942_14685 [Ignavibacteria bacterium]